MNSVSIILQDDFDFDLRTLYMHGNQIKNLDDVEKLKKFPNLRTLTLHGNPIDEIKNYRFHVISVLPNLKNLDFTAITPQDRETAEVYEKMFKKRMEKKK